MSVKIPVDRAMFGTTYETNSTFEGDMLKFEAECAAPGQIVFYGPSNFTRWETPIWGMRPMREDLLGKSGAPCVVNRGFGSSCPEHQLYYYSRIIRPLAPSVLVYCPWGNWTGFGYSAEEAWELAERVIVWTKTDFPDCRIYLVGGTWGRDLPDYGTHYAMLRFDEIQRRYAEAHDGVFFIDPKPHFEGYGRGGDVSIYSDHVHFNQKGYDMYRDFFKTALADEFVKF